VQVREEDAFLLFAGEGPGLDRTREAAAFVRTLGCEVAWASPLPPPEGAYALPLPDTGEALAPVVEAVPAQLLAGHLAAIAGVDADNFRRDEPAFGAARAAIML
jgi:fructoselysine-6-P-deglycase FrlB-like protein